MKRDTIVNGLILSAPVWLVIFLAYLGQWKAAAFLAFVAGSVFVVMVAISAADSRDAKDSDRPTPSFDQVAEDAIRLAREGSL